MLSTVLNSDPAVRLLFLDGDVFLCKNSTIEEFGGVYLGCWGISLSNDTHGGYFLPCLCSEMIENFGAF